MPRSTDEWVGASADTVIPSRVKLRVFHDFGGRCAMCTTKLLNWHCDHVVALINGGQNREGNLQPLCNSCHAGNTVIDVKTKAKIYAITKRHLGIKKETGRPMPGTKRSGLRKKFNGDVERR